MQRSQASPTFRVRLERLPSSLAFHPGGGRQRRRRRGVLPEERNAQGPGGSAAGAPELLRGGAPVLNGSRLLTDFEARGGYWVAKRPTPARSANTANAGRPRPPATDPKACSSTISRWTKVLSKDHSQATIDLFRLCQQQDLSRRRPDEPQGRGDRRRHLHSKARRATCDQHLTSRNMGAVAQERRDPAT